VVVPSVVEFFARLLARFWCWQRHIQTTFENVHVLYNAYSTLDVLHLCAIEIYVDIDISACLLYIYEQMLNSM